MLALLCNVAHCPDAGPVEIVLVATSFDEEVGLNVAFHLLNGGDKVVVSPVNFTRARSTGGV